MSSKSPAAPLRLWPIRFVVGAVIASIVVYAVQRHVEEPKLPQGWMELGGCNPVQSLDESRRLSFGPDQTAELRDTVRNSSGAWSYNSASKKFTVTINGVAYSYSVVQPTGAASCMLITGDLGSADLVHSWFAAPDNEGDPYDLEHPN